MTGRRARGARRALPVVVTLVGAAGVALVLLTGRGLAAYVAALAVAAVGAALWLGTRLRRRRNLHGLVRTAIAVVVAVVVVIAGVVAVRGVGSSTAHWTSSSGSADLSSPSGRVGDIVYVADDDAVVARDLHSGATRWRAERAHLLAVTAAVVVVGTDDEVQARDPASGAVRWSAAAPYARGIAQDGTVLVTTQNVGTSGDKLVAVAYGLDSGRVVWRDERHFAAMEIDLLNGRDRNVVALAQDTVAMFTPRTDGSDAGRPYALVRVRDEHEVMPLTSDFTGRVIGQVFVGDDPATGSDGEVTLSGWSTTDGRRLWSVRAPKLADVAGGGPVVGMVHYAAQGPVDTANRIRLLDVRTGRTGDFGPPAPWRIDDEETVQDQRGPGLWMPVSADPAHGVWLVGTSTVVDLDATSLTVPSLGQSGEWTVVTGVRRDAVGDRLPVAWAVAASGGVYGPYPASSAYVGPGLLQTTSGNDGGRDRVIPLR